MDGTLRSATPHTYVGNGDLYAVHTTVGIYVFVRRTISDGSGGLQTEPRDCHEVHEDAVPFIKVPPAMTRLWLRLMQRTMRWYWPVLDTRYDDSSRFIFIAHDPSTPHAVRARCASDDHCTMGSAHPTTESGPGAIDMGALLEFAPAAP